MKTSFLLRFQESCANKDRSIGVHGTPSKILPIREAQNHHSRAIVDAPLTGIPAIIAGTTTLTLAGHEASDTDPDRKKFHAIPRAPDPFQ